MNFKRPLRRALCWSIVERPITLLATIHTGPFGGYRFPPMADAFIHGADIAYFEIDPLEKWDIGFMFRPTNSATTLLQEVGPAIYRRLEQELALNRPLANCAAGGIGDLIELSTPTPMTAGYGIDWGVDRTVCQRYRAQKKEIRFLETSEDQGRAAVSGPLHEIVAELDAWRTTGRLPRADSTQILNAYEAADLPTLARLRSELAPLRPTRILAQLQERESRWLEKIVDIAAEKKSVLIAAGVLHFPGEDGLLSQLSRRDFTVLDIGSQ